MKYTLMKRLRPLTLYMIYIAMSYFYSDISYASVLEVPSDKFPDIQDAIDAAVSREDTVIVDDGTYKSIDFKGKAITVKSKNGPEKTTISGTKDGSVVTFSNSEKKDSILSGFTITNGKAKLGGGILCQDASPAITNCVITDNSADYGGGVCLNYSSANIDLNVDSLNAKLEGLSIDNNSAKFEGGGVYIKFSAPDFKGCEIRGNTSKGTGGGVSMIDASPIFTDCTIDGNKAKSGGGLRLIKKSMPEFLQCYITNNSAHDSNVGGRGGGVYFTNGGYPYFTNCVISGNSASGKAMGSNGGAISCTINNSAKFLNCTISGNHTTNKAGGIYFNNSSAEIILTNCIVYDNTANGDFKNLHPSGKYIVTYSSIEGGIKGEGNNDIDPKFVDAPGGDYRLKSGSPCIDKGAPEKAPKVDIAGNIRDEKPDIGAYELVD